MNHILPSEIEHNTDTPSVQDPRIGKIYERITSPLQITPGIYDDRALGYRALLGLAIAPVYAGIYHYEAYINKSEGLQPDEVGLIRPSAFIRGVLEAFHEADELIPSYRILNTAPLKAEGHHCSCLNHDIVSVEFPLPESPERFKRMMLVFPDHLILEQDRAYRSREYRPNHSKRWLQVPRKTKRELDIICEELGLPC